MCLLGHFSLRGDSGILGHELTCLWKQAYIVSMKQQKKALKENLKLKFLPAGEHVSGNFSVSYSLYYYLF